MIKYYTKLPIPIEAIQWTGENREEICKFSKGRDVYEEGDKLYIETLEGTMEAKKSDYIIKGVRGEIYPCKEDIFKKTYIEVEVKRDESKIFTKNQINKHGSCCYCINCNEMHDECIC